MYIQITRLGNSLQKSKLCLKEKLGYVAKRLIIDNKNKVLNEILQKSNCYKAKRTYNLKHKSITYVVSSITQPFKDQIKVKNRKFLNIQSYI